MEIMMPNLNEAAKPELMNMPKCEYDIQEAKELYEQKHKLVEEVFDNLGTENYTEIVASLHEKYFGQMDQEIISKHIMYRALNGSIIGLNTGIESEEFIYDDCDKTIESLLQKMLNIDNMDEARKIIELGKNVNSTIQ